uniref:Uncharacterized protein n=1 Tax=Arundo donax TaxID=35708 RepID=A0A0A9BRC5_ARUDO
MLFHLLLPGLSAALSLFPSLYASVCPLSLSSIALRAPPGAAEGRQRAGKTTMAASSFTGAKLLAPVAARSGGDRAPLLPAAGAASARPRRGAEQTRLRTALAVSSDVLAGNKAAQAAAAHPVRKSLSRISIPNKMIKWGDLWFCQSVKF